MEKQIGVTQCMRHQFEPGRRSAQWQRGADLTYVVPGHLSQPGKLTLWPRGADFAGVEIAQSLEAQFFKLLRYRGLQIICGAKLVRYCGQNNT